MWMELRGALLALVGAWLLCPNAAFAAAAPPVAPCVTVTSNSSGVLQEFCVPVTSANPLPVTGSGGGGAGSTTPGTGGIGGPGCVFIKFPS